MGKMVDMPFVLDTEDLGAFLKKEGECFSYLPGSDMHPVVYSHEDSKFKSLFCW